MTIEEKAKRFDEALAMAKECITYIPDDAVNKYMLNIFPELKENEDGKIRKAILAFIRQSSEVLDKQNQNNMIAWLEKGGDKNKVSKHVEAINEEKVDDANKVEPKFHEGEWITDGCLHCKISDVLDDRYIVDTKFGKRSAIPFKRENNYHLWNVTKDAKEGDVLFHSDSASNGIFIFKEIIDKGFAKEVICYCDYDSEDHFCLGEHHTCCWTDAKILYPATKEQRDTLMKAMANAGYTFDFERKELRKLGQSEVTKTSDQEEIVEIPFGAKDSELQEATYFIPKGFHAEIDDDKVVIKKDEKPTAWSEEDEQITLSIEQVMNCASLLNIVPEKTDKIRTWLKSLKQRIGG